MSNQQDITGQIEGCSFPQWYLEGEWTPEEIETIESVLRKHMQAYYDKFGMHATNYWRVWTSDFGDHKHFTAIKATWETGSCGGKTAQECAESIERYYTK